MSESLLQRALANSVAWYQSVLASHGLAGSHADTYSFWGPRVPPLYSNLTTLAADASSIEVDGVMSQVDSATKSVKDSFAGLDMPSGQYEVLFDAQWFARAAGAAGPVGEEPARGVRRVDSLQDFERWVHAWGETPVGTDVFVPGLLQDENVRFLMIERGGAVDAGLIANRSGDDIGISNAFGSPDGVEALIGWGRCQYGA